MTPKPNVKEDLTIQQYLDKNNETQKDFAKRIGVSKNTISNYICSNRKPTLGIAMRIQEATKGEVSIQGLLKYWEKNVRRKKYMRTVNMAQDD